MRIRPFSGYRDKSQYSQRKLENFQLSPHAITTSFAVPLKGS